MHRGYIKIWRKTLESDMYKSLTSIQRDIFISLLLLANHTEKTWEWKGETFTCKPGQFITSLDSIKKLCSKKVGIKNIRTSLNKFVKWQFLANESTKTGRLITILNWDTYQGMENETGKDNGKDQAKTRQSVGKERASNKNDKNVKNDKNKRKVFLIPSLDEIKTYCKERKNQINAQNFIDHYTSNGWKVGKNPMKDWKAAIRTWEQRNYGDAQMTTKIKEKPFIKCPKCELSKYTELIEYREGVMMCPDCLREADPKIDEKLRGIMEKIGKST